MHLFKKVVAGDRWDCPVDRGAWNFEGLITEVLVYIIIEDVFSYSNGKFS